MTVNKLNEAISLIEDRYLDMVAFEKKEIIQMSGINKPKTIRRRLVAVLIAAVLLAFGCSVAAFATNENFRKAVVSFIKIQLEDTVEQVPAESLTLNPRKEDDSGQADASNITVSRISVPDNGFASGGLFFVCADKDEYNSGSRYDIYTVSNGALSLLQKHEFDANCRIDGRDYQIRLEWAENEGSVGIAHVGSPELTDGSSTEGCYTVCQTFCSNGPKALLLLEAGGNNQPVIADLANGTATLVTANKDGMLPGSICAAEISEGGTALLLQTPDPNRKYYTVDIASGKLCCLNNLCGEYLYGCRFASDKQLVCWSVNGGTSQQAMEQLQAQRASGQRITDITVDCGIISAWVITPENETAKLVMSGTPATVYTNPAAKLLGTEYGDSGSIGVLCVSGRYAVERKADGALVVYDFLENTLTVPDNLILSDENCLDMVSSPSGTRLLLVERDRGDGALIRLSVLDMEEKRFIAIDRDPSAVGNEHRADWLDNNTVLVNNNIYDASNNNTGESWYFLYQIGNYFSRG